MTSISEESSTSTYPENNPFAGVTGRRREQLMTLHRAFSGPFDAVPRLLRCSAQTSVTHVVSLQISPIVAGLPVSVRAGISVCPSKHLSLKSGEKILG